MEVLKVAKDTNINKLAGSVANNIRNSGEVAICVVGSQAVNTAVKGCIIARRYLTDDKKDILIQPEFFDSEIDGSKVTGIKFVIKSVEI